MRGQQEFERVPFRRLRPVRRRDAMEKLQLEPAGTSASLAPMRVRIEVHQGRNSTASTMRAYRVMQEVEGVGGLASIIELTAGGSALMAQVNGEQAEHLAHSPFVRRIVTMS